MKIAIYSRKSVYTGKGESIENQIEMCRKYIFGKLPDITEDDIVIYEDEGFSAKSLDRPQFQKMLKEIKNHYFDYVVCYRLDRISRNVSDFSSLIEELNDNNISFICIKEQFDTSTPMGRAMMYIASVFAQLERETIAERVRDNMVELARTGRWLGGTTPTGYTSEKVETVMFGEKKKTACKLKIDSDEIKTVKIIYEKFLQLHSVSGVSKYLISQNIKSRTGKLPSNLWIREILSNPVYCIADKEVRNYFIQQHSDVCFRENDCSDRFGLLSYNKRDYTKNRAPRLPKDQWIIALGKHEGIISGSDWVHIQAILKENKTSNIKKMHNDYSLLSGMIFCTQCGNRMFAKSRHSSKSKHLFDYICNNKIRGGTKLCNCPNLNGQQIDDMVCEHIMQYANSDSNIYTHLEALKNDLKAQSSENPIKEIEIQIEKYNSEINRLINNLSKVSVPAIVERINKRLIELDTIIKNLTSEKEQLQDNHIIFTQQEIQIDAIVELLSNFKEQYINLTIHEKRQIIKLLIQKIEWDGENVHIFIYGES